MLWIHFKCSHFFIADKDPGTFNQSSQYSQHVITGPRYPCPQCQLLCQIDHALCFAKEKPNEWFGGINMIFAGDFYQYPLVGNTLLYTLIQSKAPQRSADIEKRLGRLAWKSVDTVVSLSEQQWMKNNPEYVSAVGRLQ